LLLQQEQRTRVIGEAGDIARGDIIVAAAGLGQLLTPKGDVSDRTAELAGEIALKKLLDQNDTDHKIRTLKIAEQDITTDIAFLGRQTQADFAALTLGSVGAGLTAAGNLSRRFRFDDGSLAFRTRTA
jgi:hypothetical protein